MAENKARGNGCFAANGIGDICAQHGNHHGKAGHPKVIYVLPERAAGNNAPVFDMSRNQCEGEQHTARNNDGEEIGNTRVEIAKEFRTKVRVLLFCRRYIFGAIDEPRRIFDRFRRADVQNLPRIALRVEALAHLDADCHGKDDDVRRVDFCLCEFVADAHAALRFDLAVDPALFAFLFDGLLCHIGMGNAGRAGGYRYDFHFSSSSISCRI